MTIIKIDKNARKFIQKYEKLCKKYKMMVAWADETEYFIETEELYYNEESLQRQIDGLLYYFTKGEKDE